MRDGGDGTSIPKPATAYLDTPYESPARVGNGTGQDLPFYSKGEPESAPRGKPLAFKIEDEPAPKTVNDELIAASVTLYTAITKRIAYHERETRRLRDSLRPFAAAARPAVTEDGGDLPDGIKKLLAIADQIESGEPKS